MPDFVLNFTVAGFLIVLTALNLTFSLVINVFYHYFGREVTVTNWKRARPSRSSKPMMAEELELKPNPMLAQA